MTTHTPTPKIAVRRQGRNWGVYRGDELIEGGFFRRDAAVVVGIRLIGEDVARAALAKVAP